MRSQRGREEVNRHVTDLIEWFENFSKCTKNGANEYKTQ